MGVVARCRQEKLKLTLHDVLKSGSIVQLARVADLVTETPKYEDRVEECFELSTIQRMYFQLATSHGQHARFNQSFSLRITRPVKASDIDSATKAILAQHSMLRARFSQNKQGIWQQRISQVCNWHNLHAFFFLAPV